MADSFGLKLGIEGEKEFKQALTDINKNFKVLGSEMKLVASQFEKNDNSVKALSARNEVLNKQIDAQKSKIESLRSALKNASESFGDNDKRTKNWQIQLNNAEAALNNMERELKDNTAQMNKTGTAADHMGDEIKQSGKQADDARSGFDNLKKTLSTVGAALGATIAAIGTAAVTAGKKIWDMANDTAEAGDEIDKQSQKLGISAENYQKLSYAMERSGADVEDFKKGTMNITKELANMQNGVDGAGSMFDQLGISVQNADGSFKSTEDVLLSTIDALSNMQDETQRNALANSVFGKSYQEILPLLNSGSDGIRQLMDEAEQYGMVMSDDAVKASAAFEDSLTKLKGTITGVKNALMSQLLPGFKSITDGFAELVSGNEEGSDMIKSGIQSAIGSVKKMIPEAVSLLSTIGAAILEEAPSVLESLASSIVELLPEALDFALNDILPNLLESVLSIAGQLFTSISESLPDLMTSLAESFSNIVTELFSADNITNFVNQLLSFIKNAIAGIGEALPIILEAIKTVALNLIDSLPEILNLFFTDFLPNLIENIGSIIKNGLPVLVQAAVELISSICQNLPLILEQLFDHLPLILDSISSALIDNIDTLIQCGIDLTIGLVKNLPRIIVGLLKAAPSILKSLAEALLSGLGQIIEVGKNIVTGLWEGIKSAASWLWDKITGWLSDIWDGIKDFFGIHSPSLKMKQVGAFLVDGLKIGIEDEKKSAVDAMTALSKDLSSVTFSPINFAGMTDDLNSAFPADFDSQMSSSVLTASQYDSGAGTRPASQTFNTNITFGNVTINDGSDVEDIAHRVSDIIANDVMVKGGAFA